jgi:hypothetical protein
MPARPESFRLPAENLIPDSACTTCSISKNVPKKLYDKCIVFMGAIAYGDSSHEGRTFNTACFLLPPFQGEIKPSVMRVVVDLNNSIAPAHEAFVRGPISFFLSR